MSQYSKKLTSRTGLTLLLAGGLVVNFVLLCVWARLYYELNFQKLRLAEIVAVKVGVEYLPADSQAAVQAAKESAQQNGVQRGEILSLTPLLII